MRHISLFNGIGGFQLAASWMGWDNVAHVETDEFCNRVVAHHFPESKQYEDIKEFAEHEAVKYRGRCDIITGGFPCQPFSNAGKRRGSEDDRHLWPEMLDTVAKSAPSYVVGENVPGILSWNGGMVFEEVCADLEALGYQVQPLLLPAAGVGAPHRRERTWFVAYADGGREGDPEKGKHREEERAVRRDNEGDVPPSLRGNGNAPDPETERPQGEEIDGELEGGRPPEQDERGQRWADFPTEPPVCSGDDGIPDGLDGISVPRWRSESIKALGNAIVPQVAFEIFRAIERTEKAHSL